MTKVHPVHLAQILIIAQNAIKTKSYRDFDFLLDDIERILKTSCKANWDEDAVLIIEEMPF